LQSKQKQSLRQQYKNNFGIFGTVIYNFHS
jgi:hypothetical protein